MSTLVKTLLLLMSPFLSLPTSPVGRTQTSTVAEQLNQIERRIAKALVERDLQTYSSFLAPDWTTTDVTGRVLTKTEVMQELSSDERQVDAATIDDIKVLELGEAAVVTGRTTASGSYQGQSLTVVLRFTDVFVKRDGQWLIVASQGTLISK